MCEGVNVASYFTEVLNRKLGFYAGICVLKDIKSLRKYSDYVFLSWHKFKLKQTDHKGALLQRRGSSRGNENHSFSDFESKQLNFVSEAFSCLSSFYSPLTLLYLGGFEIASKGWRIANHFGCYVVLTLNGKFVYSFFMIIKLPLHSCNVLKT